MISSYPIAGKLEILGYAVLTKIFSLKVQPYMD